MSPRTLSGSALLLACAFGLMGLASTARGQMVVVTTEPVSALADDFVDVVKAAAPKGDPMAPAMLAAMERDVHTWATLPGLDAQSPLRLMLSMPKTFPRGGPPTIAAAVRVNDFAKFMESLGKLEGVTVDGEPGADGFTHKVTAADGKVALYALESKGHALFSLVSAGADHLKTLDPASWQTKKLASSPTIGVTVRLSEVPDLIKNQFIDRVEEKSRETDQRRPGESDAALQARILGRKLVTVPIEQMVRDGATLAANIIVDRGENAFAVELTASAPPGTATAEALAALKGRRSRFHALCQDAAMALDVNLPLAGPLRTGINSVLDLALKAGLDGARPEEEIDLLKRFIKFVRSNVEAGEIDMAMAFRAMGPAGADRPRGVIFGAMKVKDVHELDQLIRERAKQFKPKKGASITLDADRLPDGTTVHQVAGPARPNDPVSAKLFGPAVSTAFTFHDDAAWYAVSGSLQNSVSELREAFQRAAAPAQPAAVENDNVSLVLHMKPVGRLFASNVDEFQRTIDSVFQGADAHRDRFRIGLRGDGTTARLRMAVDLPALKLISSWGQAVHP